MNLRPLRHVWRKVTPDISVVIPTRNEADNVLLLAGRIRLALSGRKVEVIFVDDSTDMRTSKVIVAARTLFRTPLFHVRFAHRRGVKRWGGLSGAVIDGIKRARAGIVIVMDGDLQHPPEVLPELIEASEDHDVVIASRYLAGGSAEGLDGGVRHFVSRGSTRLAQWFFPHRLRAVTDPMTGFFLIRRDAIDLARLHPKGFKILLEILARHGGLRVKEVPFSFGERLSGDSKGSLKQGLQYFQQLFKIKNANLADSFCRLPRLVQFGLVGGSVFGVGMLTLFALVEVYNVPLLAANAAQLILTFGLNYLFNRTLTWRDRAVTGGVAIKFVISRAATTVLNFALFAGLVNWQPVVTIAGQTYGADINYLLANVICLVVVTLLNFLVSDRWVFAPSYRTSSAAQKYVPSALGFASLTAVLILIALQSGVLAAALLLVLISLFMFVQASIEVWRTTYAYRHPEAVDSLKFPVPLAHAAERFCLIVPARHEAEVLGATLAQVAKQTHPFVTIATVICDDDVDTLEVAYAAARANERITVLEYPLKPGVKPSKPLQLNYVLDWAAGKDFTVIGIIDAEDTVHPELLAHVDAAFANRKIQIVQGGVQLMDYDSSWYSLHNVLEYWRWFNSAMAFQAAAKFMPLGGNTVFVRYKLLKKAGGWPLSLTEDCALGVHLSARFHAKTAVFYESRLATQEETPESLSAFFRQRVRWFQGFFAEWRKGTWRRLPSRRQRWLAMYVLGSPIVLAFGGLMAIASTLAAVTLKLPVGLTLLTFIPFVPLLLLLAFNVVLLSDFGKAYGRTIRLKHYALLFVTFAPYLAVLNAAALWSMIRELRGNTSWDKTRHTGKHRAAEPVAALAAASVNAERSV